MLSRLGRRGYSVQEEPSSYGIDPDFDSEFDPDEREAQPEAALNGTSRVCELIVGAWKAPDKLPPTGPGSSGQLCAIYAQYGRAIYPIQLHTSVLVGGGKGSQSFQSSVMGWLESMKYSFKERGIVFVVVWIDLSSSNFRGELCW